MTVHREAGGDNDGDDAGQSTPLLSNSYHQKNHQTSCALRCTDALRGHQGAPMGTGVGVVMVVRRGFGGVADFT